MESNPDSQSENKKEVVRDHFAAQRTMLANERTYLAYIRTALTLFVAGVTFIKFFGHIIYEITGWMLITLGIIIFIKGIISYIKTKRLITEEDHL